MQTSTLLINQKEKVPKVSKKPKEPKEPKEPKKLKKPKEPKEPKELKEPKVSKKPKEPKEPKESKKPKVPKEKVPKVTKEKVPKGPKETINSKSESKNINSQEIQVPVPVPTFKKRGRKPKGGKIISLNDANHASSLENQTNTNKHKLETSLVSTNVILHLKCSYTDMHSSSISMFKYEPNIETVESYADSNDISETACEYKNSTSVNSTTTTTTTTSVSISDESIDEKYKKVIEEHQMDSVSEILKKLKSPVDAITDASNSSQLNMIVNNSSNSNKPIMTASSSALFSSNGIDSTASTNGIAAVSGEPMKEIFKKVNRLKLILHNDNAMFNAVQHSACFWDTCEFTTPVIHIPKLYNKTSDSYTVYGCFCSPECALAYLVRESLDSSVKFERIQMLNEMYNNVCNNTDRPVKPAPDPRFTLNKYYGNLSIEEYRKLLKSDHLLYIVNKPLTHSLPELYDDNNEFLVNGRTASSSANSVPAPVPASLMATLSTSSIASASMFTSKNKNKYMFPNQNQIQK